MPPKMAAYEIALRAGDGVQAAQADSPQTPFRHVDDALERQIVVRLRHDAQVGDGVANLLTFVEAGAADDAVFGTKQLPDA